MDVREPQQNEHDRERKRAVKEGNEEDLVAPSARHPQYDPWIPLECSPSVFAKLSAGLGATGCKFEDVLSLDEDYVQSQCPSSFAFILLYPTEPHVEAFRRQRRIPQQQEEDGVNKNKGVFFLRQLNGGACGTIAVLHALLNNRQHIKIHNNRLNSPLAEFLASLEKLHSSDDDNDKDAVMKRSRFFLESQGIAQAHFHASRNETEEASGGKDDPSRFAGQRQGRHFITFTPSVSGQCLLELDGRWPKPIWRRPIPPNTTTFVATAMKEIQLIVATLEDPRLQLSVSVVAVMPD